MDNDKMSPDREYYDYVANRGEDWTLEQRWGCFIRWRALLGEDADKIESYRERFMAGKMPTEIVREQHGAVVDRTAIISVDDDARLTLLIGEQVTPLDQVIVVKDGNVCYSLFSRAYLLGISGVSGDPDKEPPYVKP